MQGGRRRVGRRQGEYSEVMRLFQELVQVINSKMQSVGWEEGEANMRGEIKVKQQTIVSPEPPILTQQCNQPQPLHRIVLKSERDWEGLCSERKEDVFGQYAICFDYRIYEEIEKDADNIQNGGTFQSRPSTNNT